MDSLSEQGVRVTVAELQRIRVEALRLGGSRAKTVNSLFSGAYQALFHGRGLEFDEVRGYQWGDDYRTLDWRVTARTGQLHTKLFHEERERTLFLVLDAGSAMHFGTRVQFKWVLAARIAALFGWLAVAAGDRVAGAVYGDRASAHFVSPGRGAPGLLRLFNLYAGLTRTGPGPASTLADALYHLRLAIKPGARTLLISDFANLDDEASRHLAYIGRHSDMAAIHVFDPMERALPPPGLYPITDGVHPLILDSRSPALRHAFAEAYRARLVRLRSTIHRYGARFLSTGTDRPLLEGLAAALSGQGEAQPDSSSRA